MLNPVVVKAGGSSVTDPNRLARWLAGAYPGPFALIVSAAKGRTDELNARLNCHSPLATASVRDALLAVGELESAALVAAALVEIGVPAVALPPSEVFDTCGKHGDAAILGVRRRPVAGAFQCGLVPVIGGFVGRGPDGLITTLGRGGSDYSAIALAASLGCPAHLLKADVDGVYSADPRVDRAAFRFGHLSHDQAVVLAAGGAKVLQRKAAELARHRRVPVWVRQTYRDAPGTWIGPPSTAEF